MSLTLIVIHYFSFVVTGVTDDVKFVSVNVQIEDIAKMTIDIKLLNFRISRSMGRIEL